MIRRLTTVADLERQHLRDLARDRDIRRGERNARRERKAASALEQDPAVLLYREERAKRVARSQGGLG